MSFPGRNSPDPVARHTGEKAHSTKRFLNNKVGKSLAVERSKISLPEFDQRPPQVIVNNFYIQERKAPSFKMGSPMLDISPPATKHDNKVISTENKIASLKSARSPRNALRLEEPEEEQMEGTDAHKQSQTPLLSKPPKPKQLVKPLPIIAISSEQ